MFGEPKDVDGECNARLFIGDNYGDGSATMRCQLAPEHEGLHREGYTSSRGGEVVITWEHNAREKCDHYCGQWKDAHDDENAQCPKDAEDHSFSTCALCHPGREPKTCEKCGAVIYTTRHYDCPIARAEAAERRLARDRGEVAEPVEDDPFEGPT